MVDLKEGDYVFLINDFEETPRKYLLVYFNSGDAGIVKVQNVENGFSKYLWKKDFEIQLENAELWNKMM